jgi:hypothetical protein
MVLLLMSAMLAPIGCKKTQNTGPDLTNPKAAALTFTRALENGDIATAQLASNAGGIEVDLIEAMAQSAMGIKQLHAAATTKFGDQANKILQTQSLSVTKNLANADVDPGETRAIVRSRDGRDVIALQKTEDGWKVDVGALIKGKDVTNVVPFFRAAGVAARSVADDITAGKLATVDAARDAMTERLVANLPRLVREQYEASTQPTSELP